MSKRIIAHSPKGKLICIEGVDGAGKCSNVELLETALIKIGCDVKVYHFPDYSSQTGKMISKFLRNGYGDLDENQKDLISVLYATNRAQYANDIENYLSAGYVVLLDRYTYSNIYSISQKDKSMWEEEMMKTEKLEFEELGLPKPDITCVLGIDPEISAKRCKDRGKKDYNDDEIDIYESNLDFQKNVLECYKHFCATRDRKSVV